MQNAIHSDSDKGKLVFKADTKGKKWSLEVREKDGRYSMYDYKNGGFTGMGGNYSRPLIVDRIVQEIIGSKKIDSINYVPSVDELSISELLPIEEKIWDIQNSRDFNDWKKALTEDKVNEFKREAIKEGGKLFADGVIGRYEIDSYTMKAYKKAMLFAFMTLHPDDYFFKKGGDITNYLNGEGEDMMSQMNAGDFANSVGDDMMDEMAQGGEVGDKSKKIENGGAVSPRFIGKAMRKSKREGAKQAGALRRKAKSMGWLKGEDPLTIEVLNRMSVACRKWRQSGAWLSKIDLAKKLIKMP